MKKRGMNKLNTGKQFEQDFKKSVPEDVFFYRFRDGTAAWDSGENTRFQQSNMCDCMIFDGVLYLLELKSHKGKSLPFKKIRKNQVEELSKANTYSKVVAGFIVNFRDVDKTYFATAPKVEYFMTHEERKSIPIAWFEENGTLITQRRLKVHYRYGIDEFLTANTNGI